MTRKKRAAPEPPIFTGAEKMEIEATFRPCCQPKPKPSQKSRNRFDEAPFLPNVFVLNHYALISNHNFIRKLH
jgi:hypothetical protein